MKKNPKKLINKYIFKNAFAIHGNHGKLSQAYLVHYSLFLI